MLLEAMLYCAVTVARHEVQVTHAVPITIQDITERKANTPDGGADLCEKVIGLKFDYSFVSFKVEDADGVPRDMSGPAFYVLTPVQEN